MIKLIPMLLLAAALTAPVRAQDEDEKTEENVPAQKAPAAAAAARNKGYQAEDAAKPAPEADDDDAPVERHDDRRVITAAPQRVLGPKGSRAADASGGGGASSAGIACDKSVPALTSILKKDIDFAKTMEGPVVDWEVVPNQAISYRFKTPGPGAGSIFTTSGHRARPVGILTTMSETPCDFDVAKARKTSSGAGGHNYCYAWGGVEGGVVFSVGPSKMNGCVLKPDTVYYFNIRALSNPDQGEPRDSCADELPAFKSLGIKPLCGGIWKLTGTFAPAAEKKAKP